MNKKLICIFLFLSVTSLQCKKESQKENNPAAKIDISAITQTDPSGQVDNTDRTEDNTWTSEEDDLFQTPTSSQQ